MKSFFVILVALLALWHNLNPASGWLSVTLGLPLTLCFLWLAAETGNLDSPPIVLMMVATGATLTGLASVMLPSLWAFLVQSRWWTPVLLSAIFSWFHWLLKGRLELRSLAM